MSDKVHFSAGNDRLEVENGGTIVIKIGGTLRVEPGAIVNLPAQVKRFATTSFAISPVDPDRYVISESDNAVTVTIPPDVDVPLGSSILFRQSGAGQVTFVAGLGVTIYSAETLKIAKQHASAVLTKEDANVWTLAGYLEPA